ncbi:MAG: caspase family protein [Candidatus Scalindua sp.]
MDEYAKYAFLGICHEGPNESCGNWIRGINDDVMTREHATLLRVKNDVEKIWSHFKDKENCIENRKLINPSVGDVNESLEEIIVKINQIEKTSSQYALVIYFAGHGHIDYGAMYLSNGMLNAEEIYNQVKCYYQGDRLQMDFIIDSCHSGRFIAHALRTQQEDHDSKIYLYDLWASCFPDEKSFELKVAEHGAYTYCFLNKGNVHVKQAELAKVINNITVNEETNSIDKKCVREIFKHIQGAGIPNPVTLLTLGKQHSFNIYRSHHVAVDGGASFEVPDKITLIGFSNTLERAKSKYGETIEYLDEYLIT